MGQSVGSFLVIGSTLKVLRERAGLSQQALADSAGMHVLGVAKLEQGLREPGWSTVLALAKALGVTPNDFLPPPETARKNLENMVSLLGLFDHLTLSQRGGAGQASWTIRLAPGRNSK